MMMTSLSSLPSKSELLSPEVPQKSKTMTSQYCSLSRGGSWGSEFMVDDVDVESAAAGGGGGDDDGFDT